MEIRIANNSTYIRCPKCRKWVDIHKDQVDTTDFEIENDVYYEKIWLVCKNCSEEIYAKSKYRMILEEIEYI